MPRQGLRRVLEFELVHHLRQAIDLRGVHPEHLPHFARRAAAPVRDDVRGHRGAETAVFFVHVLDDALATIPARQIQIDVGPLAALLRQEPLEQQIHPDRIDRRDAEAVAHGAVGRAAPPLHQDVVLPAEIDDVPDDEEIAGERELLDQIELARNLRAGALVIRPVAIARAHFGHLPQETRLRFTRRHRVFGEPVADVRHRVLQPRAEFGRAFDRAGHVGEQRRHVGRRLEIPFGVRRQPPSRVDEIRLVVNAREDVEQRALLRPREADAAGRQDGHAKRGRQLDERLVVRVFAAPAVALQLDEQLPAAEQADQAVHQAADAVPIPAERHAAGQRDQSADVAVQILECQRALAFRRAHFHARDQPAQVAISVLGFAQDGEGEGLAGRASRAGGAGWAGRESPRAL